MTFVNWFSCFLGEPFKDDLVHFRPSNTLRQKLVYHKHHDIGRPMQCGSLRSASNFRIIFLLTVFQGISNISNFLLPMLVLLMLLLYPQAKVHESEDSIADHEIFHDSLLNIEKWLMITKQKLESFHGPSGEWSIEGRQQEAEVCVFSSALGCHQSVIIRIQLFIILKEKKRFHYAIYIYIYKATVHRSVPRTTLKKPRAASWNIQVSLSMYSLFVDY